MDDNEYANNRRKSLVFVCVDGSENAMRAFEYFYEHCYNGEQTVGIVHIHTSNRNRSRRSSVRRQASTSSENEGGFTYLESTETIQKYLSLCVQLGMKTKIYSKPQEKTNSVGQAICALIKEYQPSLIVLGQRGIGVPERKVFGSVSEYVVNHGYKPILVVPPLKKGKDVKCRSKSMV